MILHKRKKIICSIALASQISLAFGAPPALDDPGVIATGAKRFNQNCVYCHGNAGSGGRAASLQDRDDFTKEYVFDVIANGKKRGAFMMPAWKATFNDLEIWELTGYILSLTKAEKEQ